MTFREQHDLWRKSGVCEGCAAGHPRTERSRLFPYDKREFTYFHIEIREPCTALSFDQWAEQQFARIAQALSLPPEATTEQVEARLPKSVTVRNGSGVLTRDLVWCECGRGLSLTGVWVHCPRCGGKIDQDSYRVACESAVEAGKAIFRNTDHEEVERLHQIIAELGPRVAFGDQCYQDQCENAYVESSKLIAVGKALGLDRTATVEQVEQRARECAEDSARVDWMAEVGEFEQKLYVCGDAYYCEISLPDYEDPFIGEGSDWKTAYRAALDAARSSR